MDENKHADGQVRWRVRIEPKGWEFQAGEGETLLHAAEAAGVMLPSSCRNGTCRTCMCKMENVENPESGQVAYLIEWPGLSREEKQEGWILPCVALARSDLVLAAPAARQG